jgi:hypothetical protein
MTLVPEVLPEKVTANYLLYGPPKNGKTAGAMTAPGGVAYLNADLPGRIRFGKSRDTEGRVQVFQLPEGSVWDTLVEVQAESQKDDWFDTVVVDPIGDLYSRQLLDLSSKALRPTLPTRGDVSALLERWCRAMCENPKVNFVMVCHEFHYNPNEGDDNSFEQELLPFTGTTSSDKMPKKLMGMVDVIGYVRRVEMPVEDGENAATEIKYLAQLRDGKGRRGGDGFDVLATDEVPFRELNLTQWDAEIQAAFGTAAEPQKEADAA